MMWLPNPLSLYHKEGFLVSKDFYSTASSGGLFALKLTNTTDSEKSESVVISDYVLRKEKNNQSIFSFSGSSDIILLIFSKSRL